MKYLTTQQLKNIALCVFTSYTLFSTGTANAGLVDITDKPLDVIEGVPANIILTMDDSGSMAWSYMPTSISGNRLTNRAKSATYNKVYYDRNVTYAPAVDKYGLSLGDASFTGAWTNGFTKTGNVNLSTSFRPTWYYSWSSSAFADTGSGDAQPAYYYFFDNTKQIETPAVACDISNPLHTDNNPLYNPATPLINPTFNPDNCYTKVVVSTTSGPTGNDETTNFANWYSYYRIRHLTSKSAATRAFSSLSDSIRVSWMGLNSTTTPGNTYSLSGSHRTNFFNWLNNVPFSGGTPLRRAFGRAGEKYRQSGSNSPYARDPGVAGTPEFSCRQNFHFAFTDGEWNSSNASPRAYNYDNGTHTLPNAPKYGSKTYTPTTSQALNTTPPIYRGSNSDYLADIALKYWATDLRTDLQNDVPVYEVDITTDIDGNGSTTNDDIFWNPKNDPAQWQHMVSFFIGMGVDGSLPFDGTTTSGTTYNQLMQGTGGGGITWGSNHIDDMWHAAINGRGQYFSASNPQDLVNAFKAVLDNIDQRTASNSAIATTSSELLSGAVLFQASYDPGNWSGEIRALDATLVPATPTSRATLNLTTKWSGKNILAGQIPGREIVTFDPVAQQGVPFTWSSLNPAQQLALNTLGGSNDGLGSDRLDYIRGDSSKEASNGGTFRNRNTSLYGDIIHSDPQFVNEPGPPVTFYPDYLESVAYSTFVTAKAGRPKMLLFGANDGMLHILNADTGVEILGYVPSPVFRNLSELTNPAYDHKFFVDQTVRVEDVFFNNAWHTIAVGGLGKGGQGIYAIDITDPGTLSETTAGAKVLWEFTDQDDADLGYSYTRPQLFKMNNGQWMAGFSNGHNSNEDDTALGGQKSATGNGIMYFIDLEKGGKGAGSTLIKLDTKVGIAQDPTGAGRANRLTDFVAIDTDQNFTIDYLYAGDLFGNLWKFDISDANPVNWRVMGDAGIPKPLFTATDPSGTAQPITLKPQVLKQRTQNGRLVYFGTSKYLETADRTDTSIQSVYGVWDREETDITATIGRNHLVSQWIDFEGTTLDTDGITPIDFRTSTSNVTSKKYGRYEIDWFTTPGLPAAGSGYLGWYIDLGVTGSTVNSTILAPDGEKIDNHLFVDASGDGVVEFATLVPNTDPCDKGGNSWLYRLDPYTGNLFGGFEFIDKSTLSAPNSAGTVVNVSAAKFPKRSSFTKTYDTSAGECTEVNIVNASDGSIGISTAKCSNKGMGRRSWRQILIE